MLCLAYLPCRGEDCLYFILAGQSQYKGQYVVKKSDLLHSGYLYFTLGGAFASQPIEVRLSVKNAIDGTPTQGAELSLGSTTITANREGLRISQSIVNELRAAKQQLTLTLASTIAPDAVVSLIATQANTANELGTITIRIEGLRTPGSETYRDEDLFSYNILPAHVKIYSTPLKKGDLTVDLQNILTGRSGTIELIDLLGITSHTQRVVSGSIVQIPASAVNQGLYFVKVSIEGIPIYTGRAFVGE